MSTSSTSYSIRDALPDDTAAIAGLLTQLNEAEGSGMVADAQALERALFGEVREVNLQALVVEQEDRVVAAALYYRGYDVLTASYGYHLADFVVEEVLRRQGIGRQLFSALASQNLRTSGQWISLTVLSGNLAAHQFYKALGMTQVAVDFFAIGEKGLISVATLLQK